MAPPPQLGGSKQPPTQTQDNDAEPFLLALNQTRLHQQVRQYADDLEQRVEMAAWTMMAHSLLNLELTKVKR